MWRAGRESGWATGPEIRMGFFFCVGRVQFVRVGFLVVGVQYFWAQWAGLRYHQQGREMREDRNRAKWDRVHLVWRTHMGKYFHETEHPGTQKYHQSPSHTISNLSSPSDIQRRCIFYYGEKISLFLPV